MSWRWSQDQGSLTGNATNAANEWRRRMEMAAKVNNDDAHGSAAWLSGAEANDAGLTPEFQILLGRLLSGEKVGYSQDAHLLTLAPTGAGKGVGVVLPNQLYQGSMLAVDPKGSLPTMAAKVRRSIGQSVYSLDPWGISSEPTSSINPFDVLDPDGDDITDDAKLLAESFVLGEAGKNQFFSDNARTVVRALILHIVTSAPRDYWNVSTLLDLAYRSGPDFEYLLEDMGKNAALGGQVRKLAGVIRNFPEDVRGSVLTTVTRSLDFLHSPRMQKALGKSDFSFRDLKRKRITVYLVLPEERLESYARWLRLMISLAVLECGRERNTANPQVLFLLDEFAALGRMEIIETALGLMRGYGIRFWPILQDYSQLTRLYDKAATSFLANSGVIQVFNVNDIETARMVSERLGKETRHVMEDTTRPHDVNASHMIGRDLLMPDEVMRLPGDQQILMYTNMKPLIARKIKYFEEPDLASLFDPDPYRR